ncbi:MAG: HAMP domain-containing histidine kinase [Oscillospiraceae bacterium]|jgi:signal transduction histidine kinase|nr:HAMP domain-containing histidine kinase [Oscillospiraceae bacterium]
MTDRLADIFGVYTEAVVAVRGGALIYGNPAACKLFPNLLERAPEELFPKQFLESAPEGFSGEIRVNGARAAVSAVTVDGCRIFTVFPPAADAAAETGTIVGAATEELKKTLSVMKIASDFVLPVVENLGDARLARYAAMIYRAYFSLLRTSGHLEALGDALRGGGTLEKSRFDLVTLCAELASTVSHLIGEGGADVVFETALPALPFYGDAGQIGRMILNLITNSLTFTPRDGRVTLMLAKLGESARITVADTGEGVSADARSAVWARYEGERDFSEPRTGAGFGLTVVHHIARLHGGSALLESHEGTGTAVTVSLPIPEREPTGVSGGETVYGGGSIQEILTELSPVLDAGKYSQRYLD